MHNFFIEKDVFLLLYLVDFALIIISIMRNRYKILFVNLFLSSFEFVMTIFAGNELGRILQSGKNVGKLNKNAERLTH